MNENFHFLNKDPEVLITYNKLVEFVKSLGNVDITLVKSAILISNGTTFLAVKPKKSWLDVEFVLGEMNDEFPIYKMVQISAHHTAHFIKLESPDEVDQQLKKWLKQSYTLVLHDQ